MTSTDTTATAPLDLLQQIEATLSADWQKAVSVVKEAAQFEAAFMAKVASGAEIVISDIESIAAGVAGKLTTINAGIAAAGTLAAAIAPNNTSVQKVLSDLSTGAQDVADLSTALSSGSSARDPQIVSTAVTAINAANQLAQLVSNATSTIGTLAANSPTATQAVTAAPTPAA